VKLRRDRVSSFDQYPFSLPAVRNLHTLPLHPAVTFIIGENGSGKSTLLEAIAVAWGFNPEGGTKNFSFHTRSSHSSLHEYLTLIKGTRRPKDGFFLRAESFFNLATDIERMDAEPAPAPPIINSYGGRSLHEQSHGESFFALMINRFGGQGFYVLDEPEAALSPSRLLSMIARMHQLVQARSQFIIATHSPILMTYPNAWLYQITQEGLTRTEYQQTEHYIVAKRFLNDTNNNSRRFLALRRRSLFRIQVRILANDRDDQIGVKPSCRFANNSADSFLLFQILDFQSQRCGLIERPIECQSKIDQLLSDSSLHVITPKSRNSSELPYTHECTVAAGPAN
jgi:predicted ATPase